jgi:16S rRNA (uracil1498-N3)-methyltransferase
MQLFYDPTIQSKAGDDFPAIHHLIAEESWHCAKVLRMKAGENITVADGKGSHYTCKILFVNQKSTQLEILSLVTQRPANYRVHIAVAPVKNTSRFEWFLEKATEIGIDVITPLICHHSEKVTVRTDRLNKIITSAMKQSLGFFHPTLNEPVALKDLLNNCQATGKYFGWCGSGDEPLLSGVCQTETDVTVLIGPEGDFSPEEAMLAKNAGFISISLGEKRLRTETAALAACFAVHFANRSI